MFFGCEPVKITPMVFVRDALWWARLIDRYKATRCRRGVQQLARMRRVRRIEHKVADEVVAEVDVRPRNVVVLEPGMIPRHRPGNCAVVRHWR
jgi:hypothetical protein